MSHSLPATTQPASTQNLANAHAHAKIKKREHESAKGKIMQCMMKLAGRAAPRKNEKTKGTELVYVCMKAHSCWGMLLFASGRPPVTVGSLACL